MTLPDDLHAAPCCNVCDSTSFGDVGRRIGVRCEDCGSLERTRVAALLLARRGRPRPGDRVLHFAPESGLAALLRERVGAVNYRACDAHPEAFGPGVERFDLCREAADLPADHYDLIVHSHVIEHLPCNYTAVLFHLQRALRPGGIHLMCVPFLPGSYDDSWEPLDEATRTDRFGQWDHVRKFGADDVAESLGMVLRVPTSYDLEREIPRPTLDRHAIPPAARRGFTPHTVLALGKEDLLLVSPPR